MWVNWRSSREDVINTFKILAEEFDNAVNVEPVGNSEPEEVFVK